VTAGLAKAAFGLTGDVFSISIVILAICSLTLIVGGYAVLDRLVKVLMAVLAAATLLATILVIPQIDWAMSGSLLPKEISTTDVFFIVALLGFMPSSVDLSVWHSLWSVAKARDTKRRATLRESLDDFHVGYLGTFLLALCFVLLGTGVMHNSGIEFETTPAGFAGQLINLYQQTLGDWSGPLIGAIAVAVMFSTVLAGLDGYPRAAVSMIRLYKGRQQGAEQQESIFDKRAYAVAVSLLALGSLFILYFLVSSLQVVVDIAATIMFLFAPVIAILNHRVMKSSLIADEARPGNGLFVLSFAGIIWLSAFSAYFLYLRFLA
jgi:Mn2+/Fe2+ NRAMP family transporter